MIKFTIEGEPVAKARARTFYNKRAGKVMSYTPKDTANFENRVATTAAQFRPKEGLIEGMVSVWIEIYRGMPKSMSKKKRLLAEERKIRPITRPDGDNYEKGICDALKGILWHDDGQIVTCRWQKWYSNSPRVEVEVWTEADGKVK